MPLGQLDREEALYTFFSKRNNFIKGTQSFLKCYKLGQSLEPSQIWKTTENMIIWALKKSEKMSFIVQLQTQDSINKAAKTAPPISNQRLMLTKPAQLCLAIAIAIVCIARNDNVVDMVWVVLFWVGRLVILWLFIVRSDNTTLMTN